MNRRPSEGQIRQARRQTTAKESVAFPVPNPPQESVAGAVAELRKGLLLATSRHWGHRLTYLRQFFRRKEFIGTPGLLGGFSSIWSPFPASRIYFAPSIGNNDAALPVNWERFILGANPRAECQTPNICMQPNLPKDLGACRI